MNGRAAEMRPFRYLKKAKKQNEKTSKIVFDKFVESADKRLNKFGNGGQFER